jgi:hypothetical protein
MSYFLTDEQEHELNLFLDEENRNICEQQLESDDVPEELKQIIRSTIEAGSPIPAFNPIHGYYSISFTPCEEGNRIYAHHHLTNKSVALYDPSKVTEQLDDLLNTNTEQVEEPIDSENISNEPTSNFIDYIKDINPEKLTVDDIESMFGPPPEEMVTFDQK